MKKSDIKPEFFVEASTESRRKVNVFVLMPFAPEFDLVYTDAIRGAFKKLNSSNAEFEFFVSRTDARSEAGGIKIQDIELAVQQAHLIIADVTGYNPNVMWEYGFALAKRKYVIPIVSERDLSTIPFNIRGRELLKYEEGRDGLTALAHHLSSVVSENLRRIAGIESSMLEDPIVRDAFETAKTALASMDKSSSLALFVSQEMARARSQFGNLKLGRYEMRNERKMEEIVQLYCDLLAQCDGPDCSFDTVSWIDFWREFTEDGVSWRYLIANRQAAAMGTKIRRVFVVNKDTFGKGSPEDHKLRSVLAQNYKDLLPYGEAVELRIYLSDNLTADMMHTYQNFALLRRRSEQVLLFPQFSHEKTRHMLSTEFVYFDPRQASMESLKSNETRLKHFRSRFDALWPRATPLTEEYLLDAIPKT